MISLIVAFAKNNVIGKEGKIPWNIEGEQSRFKELTTNNIFSSTQNISLIYAKSKLFSKSSTMSIKLLPISLDGTPIEKIKIDLNQNFINPIQKKFNFNPLTTSGDKYFFSQNTIFS